MLKKLPNAPAAIAPVVKVTISALEAKNTCVKKKKIHVTKFILIRTLLHKSKIFYKIIKKLLKIYEDLTIKNFYKIFSKLLNLF